MVYRREDRKVDWKGEKKRQLEGLMKLDPRRTDVAYILGVGVMVLDRYIKKEYNMSFLELRDASMSPVKNKLVKIALEQAFTGTNNTMLIFCLKNLCHWTDKHQISGDARAPIVLKYKLDDL